jgi:hypothetical protein
VPQLLEKWGTIGRFSAWLLEKWRTALGRQVRRAAPPPRLAHVIVSRPTQ